MKGPHIGGGPSIIVILIIVIVVIVILYVSFYRFQRLNFSISTSHFLDWGFLCEANVNSYMFINNIINSLLTAYQQYTLIITVSDR